MFSFSLFNSKHFCLSSSGPSPKTAPLNINKVSSSLLSFGRKLISPAISGGSGGISPINSEVHSSSSSASTSPATAPAPAPSHPLAGPPPGQAPLQPQSHAQTQHYRLLKSESMPVHLSKGEQRDSQMCPFVCWHFLCGEAACPDIPPVQIIWISANVG